MSTNFSPDVNRLIQQEFSYGRYSSEEELVVEAVRLLGERDRLREHVEAGSRQLAAGEYTDYDSAALRQRFAALKAGQSFGSKRDT